jgi:hypothetical protein
MTRLAEWWHSIKDNLVEVLPDDWWAPPPPEGHVPQPYQEGDPPGCKPIPGETLVYHPGVTTKKDQLRGFLKSIGLTITLYWKEVKRGKTLRYPLDRARLTATIDPGLLVGAGGSPSR